MECKKCFKTQSYNNAISAALLFLRLVVGLAFVYHGWGKIQTPFSWMPTQIPVTIPAALQFLAALAEFGGGIALILGFLTRMASLGLVFTMGVAVYFHMILFKDPFVHPTGGSSYEPSMGYLAIALLFLAMGPGKFSLDRLIFGEK